jgi:hypothetical protein
MTLGIMLCNVGVVLRTASSASWLTKRNLTSARFASR